MKFSFPNNRIFKIITIILSLIIYSCNKNEDSNDSNNNQNTPPTASFSIMPTTGPIETTFELDASSCSDKEDQTSLLKVRWDWENDGIWDTDWSSNKIVMHKFSQTGEHSIVCEVQDKEGLNDSQTQKLNITSNNNDLPTAIINVNAYSGTTLTNFEFDASQSFDSSDSISELQVRWDFDGDGTWDTNWDIAKIDNHIYNVESVYIARLEVKNTLGLTDDTTQTITVSNNNSFIDSRDGKEYQIVQIGNQIWFAENLNYSNSGSGAWCYDLDPLNCDKYGALYEFADALLACPSGWHLPSDNEWKTLEGAVDSQYGIGNSEWDGTGWRGHNAGKRLKSSINWQTNNGIDAYGFTALPGGYRTAGGFKEIGETGYWWSSTPHWSRLMKYDQDGIERRETFYEWPQSVRCIKD